MWRVLCPSLGRECSQIRREITRQCQFVRSSCPCSPQPIGLQAMSTSTTQAPSFAGRALTAVAVTAVAVGIYSYAFPQPVAFPDRPASQGPQHDPLVDVVESSLQEDTHAITAHAEQLDSMTAAAGAREQATHHTSSPGGAGPWITDEALAGAMQRRAISENRLRGYLHIKQREVQTWLDQAQMMGRVTREEFEKQMIAVEDEVNLKTNQIMYGVNDPHARKNYLAAYGCTKWSEEALRVVRSYSPLLELGAGLGHWQRELQARGADVLAVDDYSALPVPDVRITKPEFAGKVLKGDESEVVKHPRRTLLLVYPGPDDMAAAALKLYKGNTLLYVGESRGGVNANDAFFDALAQDWECDKTVPVEPFPEGYEKLWVLKRKQKARRGWLW